MSLATDDVFTGSFLCVVFVEQWFKWYRRKACLWEDVDSQHDEMEAYICYQCQNFTQIFKLLILIDIPNIYHLIFQGLTVDPRKTISVQWFTTKYCSVADSCNLISEFSLNYRHLINFVLECWSYSFLKSECTKNYYFLTNLQYYFVHYVPH
jgi:hypothetical protein